MKSNLIRLALAARADESGKPQPMPTPMMWALMLGLAAAGTMAVSGCSSPRDESPSAPDMNPASASGGAPASGNGMQPTGGGGGTGGQSPPPIGTPDAASAPIPIQAWLHQLVFEFGELSAPDTVEDKNLKDTDDPAAFDSLLPM